MKYGKSAGRFNNPQRKNFKRGKSVSITYVLLIGREAMVDASGKNNHIILDQVDADPLVLLASDVEVALAVNNIPNLLILVQVLGKEHLHLVLVDVAHALRRHADLVAVLVAALLGNRIDGVNGRAVVVEDTKGCQLLFGDGAAGIVGLALVALSQVHISIDTPACVIGYPPAVEAQGGQVGNSPACYRTNRPSF